MALHLISLRGAIQAFKLTSEMCHTLLVSNEWLPGFAMQEKPRGTLTLLCRHSMEKALPNGRAALPWQGAQHANSSDPAMPLSRDDFVAAIVTDEWHEKLAHAGRAWRQV